MTTQQVSDVLSTPQIEGRRSEWTATSQVGGLPHAPDGGFDDMKIPGWSDYVEARTAALRRIACRGEISRES